MEFIELIKIFWFFLPAGIANMSPVLFKFIKFLNYPVDLNKKIKGKSIFGKNKTYRGLFFGILLSIIFVYIQSFVFPFTNRISLINYPEENLIWLGFLLGFGALFGDLIKSFFKRQLNISPGKSWIPFDQIDWIVGAVIFVQVYVHISLIQSIIAIVFFAILHPIINILGYLLRLKNNVF
ncbi:MAG: CDP-archaeol synthase [Candidatus Nanoarchaeia archaeon]|nr:CDP-archaeol synthase [Candidatus Nanoarchaeia archaeon]